MVEEQTKREHQQKVDEIRKTLTNIGVAFRRPQMIYNTLYHPDLVATIDGDGFILIEVINTSYGFDVLGMLSLVMTKDIIDYGLCIITDKIYNQDPTKFGEVCKLVDEFKKYSNLVYGNNLIILREYEVIEWFRPKIKKANLWGFATNEK